MGRRVTRIGGMKGRVQEYKRQVGMGEGEGYKRRRDVRGGSGVYCKKKKVRSVQVSLGQFRSVQVRSGQFR